MMTLTTHPRRRLAALAAALMLALATVACDVGDEPAPPDGTPPGDDAEATAPSTPTPEPDATEEPTATPREAPAEAWSAVPSAPVALTEVAGAAHEGRMWVVGGLLEDGSAATSVLVFDPAAETWTEGPSLPRGLHHTALVSTGDALYVVGGLAGAYPGRPTDAILRLADDGESWSEGPPLPEARGAGAAAWDGARIVYGGGLTSGGGVADDVWALEDGEWRDVGSLTNAREHLAATSDGQGRTWFMGGRQVRLTTNVGDVDLVEGDEVRALEAELTPRSGVAAFWSPETGPCLVGGEGPDGTYAEVECLNDGEAVRELPSLEVARHGLGAAVIDGAAYVLLGGERPGLYVSDAGERLPLTGMGQP
jgi:hypothetical protein